MKIKIHLINQQKQFRLPLKTLTRQLQKLARQEPLPHKEISFIFLDPKEMAKLNQRYLNHSGSTDVITFQHGEIFICPAIAKEESQKRKISFSKEILLYAIHGWLHLRGFNDKTVIQSQRMEQHQHALLDHLYSQS